MLDTIFDEIVVREGRLASATPRAGWLDYFDEATTVGAFATCGQRGVGREGIEPPQPKAADPESGACARRLSSPELRIS